MHLLEAFNLLESGLTPGNLPKTRTLLKNVLDSLRDDSDYLNSTTHHLRQFVALQDIMKELESNLSVILATTYTSDKDEMLAIRDWIFKFYSYKQKSMSAFFDFYFRDVGGEG